MDLLIVLWLAMGAIAAIILSNKGRSGCGGFALGFLLGPIGIVIAIVMSPDHTVEERRELQNGARKRCPVCAEPIRAEAIKCRFCGAELTGGG